MSFYGLLLSGGPIWVFVRLITLIFTVVALLRLVPGKNRQVANYRARPGAAVIKGTSVFLGMTGLLAVAIIGYGAMQHAKPFHDYVPHGKVPVGVYADNESTTWGGIHSFEATSGRRVSYVLAYINTGQPFPHYIAQQAAQHKAEPVIQIEPRNDSLAHFTGGRQDRYLKHLARQVRTYRHPVVLSWAPEANGTWYPWGWTHASLAFYRASWQHVMKIFRPDHNVTWMDTINISYPHSAPIRNYVIPHVMIGIDGYYRIRHSTFSSVFGYTISQIRSVTHEPIMISAEMLTNAEAAAIQFRADPDQVVMGDFVEIRDPAGKRIGHVSTASYHERLNGPAYVNVGIELR